VNVFCAADGRAAASNKKTLQVVRSGFMTFGHPILKGKKTRLIRTIETIYAKIQGLL